MTRYIAGRDRRQSFLLPECVDDYVGEDNPVRVVDAFVEELDLAELGFGRTTPADTGHPGLTVLPRCSTACGQDNATTHGPVESAFPHDLGG